VDLGGGWTDVPPYDEEQGGCVCNVAIARYATVRLAERGARRPAAMPALAAHALARAGIDDAHAAVTSDFPVGAGLGGSSAAGVALAAACLAWSGATDVPGDDAARAALAERSRAVEVEELGIAGGRQDHYAAALGGALRLDFEGGARVRVTRLALAPATREALARRLVVVYTGESRISAETITTVVDAYRRRERRVVGALARMRDLAAQMSAALVRGDVDEVGGLLDAHWREQRSLHPAITTPRIEALLARGAAAGALGAKALGASGGGCVALLAADGREAELRAAVRELGEVLDAALDAGGVTVAWPGGPDAGGDARA
jgi:D-glycero-alpha-D-manno-heptose-7-phosphate kinase